jgi:Allophanate hydrolase subunit 2
MSAPADRVPIATVGRVGLVTAQDIGRVGFTDVGVPVSGAWHRARHRWAVALVHGDTEDAHPPYPTLEILRAGLSLAIHEPQVVAVVGSAEVRIDANDAATGVALHIAANSVLDIDHRGPGPAYLALSGWHPHLTLGSASTDSFSSLGGLTGDGTPVTRGQTLLGRPDLHNQHVGSFLRTTEGATGSIWIIAKDVERAELFCNETWRVDSVARSGVRLSGPKLPARQSIASMPVVPGAIQLTPDGTAIVLGPDGGLTGGYPIVGVVASAYLDRTADLTIGDTPA